MKKNSSGEAFTKENREKIILTYFNKAMNTVKELMSLMSVDFLFDRLLERYEDSFIVDTVLLLMERSRKMYNAIEMLTTIFKLVNKRQVMLNDIKRL